MMRSNHATGKQRVSKLGKCLEKVTLQMLMDSASQHGQQRFNHKHLHNILIPNFESAMLDESNPGLKAYRSHVVGV